MMSSDQKQYPGRKTPDTLETERNVQHVALEQAGWRLDKFLSLLVPHLGMRGRRRLIEQGRVRVNGRFRPSGFRLRQGQEVKIISVPFGADEAGGAEQGEGVRVLARKKGYAALFKPGGVHTAALAGNDGESLEKNLRLSPETEGLLLVNRLDRLTSGIVMAAETTALAKQYKVFELSGQIEKTYFAVVHGLLKETFTVRNHLDTAKRKLTRVLARTAEDKLRWTRISPLGCVRNADLTLVRAAIHRGARHQIRAHLASAGFPIVGDPLYGSEVRTLDTALEGVLHLHHARIVFPEFCAQCLPDWTDVDVHRFV